jgi:putative addiction module CopG family antidote
MIILSGLFAVGWRVTAGVGGWKVENFEKIGLDGRRGAKREPMDQMNVSITDRLAGYARKKVKSGRYNNASEVVREALRRMEDEDARGSAILQET